MSSEWLEKYCLSLPGVSTDIKWDDNLTYLVGDKMFAITGVDQEFRVSLKVDPEIFMELIEREGIIQAPYFARNQWISIQDATALERSEWEELVRGSYDLVFSKLTKKKQEAIKQI